ncbi:Na(+)/H(+) exchange regulatory cofactor NHE-RF1-like [Stegodyphus dumicola]|uniref:Na(+)/H(+) exchange regulatory cofactor NHE-RF1-like n=1 Tax=Stegodyphus dumicola TaxID=202533 RepID=UPI0015B1609F|nr:Na(+)/H(+) exchange regulatory cofactor NHE-RF1-like [Stegodyphus dumicola]
MSSELPPDAPAPRLCHLIKWVDFDGYGFNLHAEKSRTGQFIGKVDDDSPAQHAGLREGDRIIEVNGVNIANENHRQVVERIKSIPNETKLLVVDEEADKWYKERKIVVKSTQPNVLFMKTPIPRPNKEPPAYENISPSANNVEKISIENGVRDAKSSPPSASKHVSQNLSTIFNCDFFFFFNSPC